MTETRAESRAQQVIKTMDGWTRRRGRSFQVARETTNSRSVATWLAGSAAAALVSYAAVRGVVRRRRRMELRGRRVFITGGSRGLGLGLAREFAGRGCRVAIGGRDVDALRRVQQEFRRCDRELAIVGCDVTDRESALRGVESVREALGGIDVLVNNAGVMSVGPFEEMTWHDYEQAMATHVFGPLRLVHAVWESMRDAGGGRIVNIASIGGKLAVPHMLPYSASKFGLVGLSDGLRAALSKENIFVTTVCPGLMRTGSPRHVKFRGQPEQEYAWFTASDTAPLVSIDVDRAARRIVDACRDGESHLVLSVPAKLGSLIQGVAPAATAEAMALVNRLLPAAGGDSETRLGSESRPKWFPSFLAHRDDLAAASHNEKRDR